MIKRTQNKVAESRKLLPFIAVYGILVWLAHSLFVPCSSSHTPLSVFHISHLITLVCIVLSAALMIVLNNSNALIRTYSRTVSCSFIALTCMLGFQFDSISGAFVCLCIVAFYLCAFRTYQDKESPGWIFYAFFCIGLASILFPLIFIFVPVFWLFMKFQLNSLSWRTFLASLLGLSTPYWFLLPYMLWKADFTLLQSQFSIVNSQFSILNPSFTLHQLLSYAWIVILTMTGIIHFLRHVLSDKIRTRQFYGCFIWMSVLCVIAIPLLPQYYDPLIRLLIVSASPLIAHFLTLTHTRITDIAFKVICVVTLLITLFNLWMPSLNF